MKTDKNSQTNNAGLKVHPEPAITNTPARYKVALILAQRSYGSIHVEAASLEEAKQKAAQVDISDVRNWEIYEDIFNVESVEIANEGGNHVSR